MIDWSNFYRYTRICISCGAYADHVVSESRERTWESCKRCAAQGRKPQDTGAAPSARPVQLSLGI